MKSNGRFQSTFFRWTTIFLVILFALLASSCNTEKSKVYRVGILSGLDYMAGAVDGFKAGMAELGYVEGQNIEYDLQSTNFDIAAYQRILQQFVADKVDLIFVFPTEASIEAKTATQGTDIPVVFSIANIEDTGLVNSLREPGGNITGVRYPGPDIALKRFEVMLKLAPETKHMLVPYQRGYPIVASQLEILRPVAAAAGVSLIEIPADNAAELEAAVQELASGDVDAVLLLAEPLAVTPDTFLVMAKFAAGHQIPLGGAYAEVEGYTSIFGVNIDPMAVGKQAAFLADKIFRGTPAGTIPVVSAESYMTINYSAAQELGLTVPESLLAQANQVIH